MSVNDLPMPNASNYLPSLWNVDVRRRGVRGADVGVNHLTVDTDGRLHRLRMGQISLLGFRNLLVFGLGGFSDSSFL